MRLAGRRARRRALGAAAAAPSARQRLREGAAVHAADVRAGRARGTRPGDRPKARPTSRSCSSMSAGMSGCSRCSWRRRARAARASWRSSRSPAISPGSPSTSPPIPACRSSRCSSRFRTMPRASSPSSSTAAIAAAPARASSMRAKPARTPCACRAGRCWRLLREQGIERIDALKLDVEGMEDVDPHAVPPRCAASLWPQPDRDRGCARTLVGRSVRARLRANGYTVSSRSKLNVMLRRTGDQSSERHRVGDREAVRRHRAAIGDRLDAARCAPVERPP